jgi:mRNA interferase RelE/StbE
LSYRIEIKAAAAKALEALPKQHQRRIAKAIDALTHDPRPEGVKKLAGGEGWRIRAGDYRIIYTINDSILTVCIIRIGHRRDVYKKRG